MGIDIITIEDEIKIIGLSYKKLGLPETIESLEKMWNIYGKKYRHRIKGTVTPLVDYGVNDCLLTDEHEYIAGCAVTEIGELDENWVSFVAPPGKYVRHTSKNTQELFAEDIGAWAKANGITLNDNFMIEGYPDGYFEGKDVEVYTLRLIQAE